jgi:biotin carboxylase
MASRKNIFVVALDDFQRYQLETIHNPDKYAFHDLLGYDRVIHQDHYPFEELLEQARRELDAFDGTVHAILAHWDFPTTALVPILAAERGLRAPPLAAVARCEHKYWCRVLQRQAIPELTPAFGKVDPLQDADQVMAGLELDFPFWLKPIKAYSSHLGFKVEDHEQLEAALGKIRAELGRFSDPFDQVLSRIELPAEIREVSGRFCIAEEYMTGVELAHEGHAFQGQVRIHGVLDMVRERETFVGYEYPSELPERIQQRINEAGVRLLQHIGFDDGLFNAEYFWNPEDDSLRIIEVNPRLSQSHSYLFHTVDGSTDHEILIDIALGREPHIVPRRGKYPKAAKMFLRSYRDGLVHRIPSPRQVAEIRTEVPDSFVDVVPRVGERLGELPDQDAYSFELAVLYVPATSHEELMERYHRMCKLLARHFEIEDTVDEPAAVPLGREARP